MAALPAPFLNDLRQGASRADFIQLSNVIGRIREHDSDIADTLERLAEDFDYDEILALIQVGECRNGDDEFAGNGN